MRTLALALTLSVFAVYVSAQEPTPADSGIAPPADVQIQPPAPEVVVPEAIPSPAGEREGRLELGREIDLGKLREQIGPEGRRFLHRSGDRGISFGLDMAERGINFGLRYANGQATPADARAFGIDMGRRGKAFGLEMRDRSLDAVEGALEDLDGDLPRDGRDAKFQETPGNITIDAPPVPLGATRPLPEARIYGRDAVDREVKFRREF